MIKVKSYPKREGAADDSRVLVIEREPESEPEPELDLEPEPEPNPEPDLCHHEAWNLHQWRSLTLKQQKEMIAGVEQGKFEWPTNRNSHLQEDT